MTLPNNNLLDIIISLALVYALLSVLVSILIEWWSHYSKMRGTQLKNAIYQLLNDQAFNYHYGELFYNHISISGLRNERTLRPPQYISSKLFADVLIDVIANQKLHDQPINLVDKNHIDGKQYALASNVPVKKLQERFADALAAMNASPLKDLLQSLHDKADGNYDKLKQLIEDWYNDYMDRVSGWYKTSLRKYLNIFGFAVAISLNVDSVHLVKVLSLDSNLRNSLVNAAENVADNYKTLSETEKNDWHKELAELNKAIDSTRIDSAKQKIILQKERHMLKKVAKDPISAAYLNKADSVLGMAAKLNLPLGWDAQSAPLSWFPWNEKCCKKQPDHRGLIAYNVNRNECHSFKNVFWYIIGIVISGLSLSFGAPFWFELLVKLVNIRRAGKKPEVKVTNT